MVSPGHNELIPFSWHVRPHSVGAHQVVSLMFHELTKIFSPNLCIAEIVVLMRILSCNFVHVPKAMLWAHVLSFSRKSSLYIWFSGIVNFREIILESSQNVIKTTPLNPLLHYMHIKWLPFYKQHFPNNSLKWILVSWLILHCNLFLSAWMTKLIITSDDGDITQQAIIMIIIWSNNDLVNRHFYLSLSFAELIHWAWVTHICICKLTIIGSDYGLSPGWHQAIISQPILEYC